MFRWKLSSFLGQKENLSSTETTINSAKTKKTTAGEKEESDSESIIIGVENESSGLMILVKVLGRG